MAGLFRHSAFTNSDMEHAARDLQTELHQARARVEGLERENAELKLECSKAHANEMRMKRNFDMTRKGPLVPAGDMDEGYECPACYAAVEYEDDRYCHGCGARLDWHPTAPDPDEGGYLYDRLRDEQLDRALGWGERR